MERNERLIEFHKADTLVRKIEQAKANGLTINATVAIKAAEWRADAARRLRQIGLGDEDE